MAEMELQKAALVTQQVDATCCRSCMRGPRQPQSRSAAASDRAENAPLKCKQVMSRGNLQAERHDCHVAEKTSRSMKYRQRVRFANETGLEIEKEIKAPISFGIVDAARHQDVSRIMIPLRLDQAGVEGGQFGIDAAQLVREDLKLLTTASFDQRAANEMIDDLAASAVPHCAHQPADPRARILLAEFDAASLQKVQDELKMLKLFNGDRVQFLDARVEIAVLLEIQGRRGSLPFEVRMIHEHRIGRAHV